MCGITAIYNKSSLEALNLVSANSIISHRGPDDEGYLLLDVDNKLQVYAGKDTALQTQSVWQYPAIPNDKRDWKVGLGHRRLSIIDLSPAGHQPMVLQQAGLSITFNGEIYNYLELREELRTLGCVFRTHSDTEVILHAWNTWGEKALHKFNGMFAFVLLDTKKKKLYAVRDRFGVKPLYYTQTSGYIAFASEVKQLRVLPEYEFKLNQNIAFDYLRDGSLDHEEETFDQNILQIMPGNLIEVDVTTSHWEKRQWYSLLPLKWEGTEQQAADRFYELLSDSVRLRMRADVLVGSALSGGLDSSTIVCLMREALERGGTSNLIKTITSCQTDKAIDEWEFADMVNNQVKATPHKVFPTFEKLVKDLDRLMWHMDYPFGSTSQFSQWCVFEEAKKQGLTVMIDGQGADEQLAGYGGNDLALYTGLLGKMKWVELAKEIVAYKKYRGNWPSGFVIGALQHHMPGVLKRWVPDKYLVRKEGVPQWLKQGGMAIQNFWPSGLSDSLLFQVTSLPLPSLLRYEDRNSMAFSVESRVPFMDYRLIEFTLGLPENLVYRRGERKYLLRQAFKGVVPDAILRRKDKMGFVSAEERWMKKEGKNWFFDKFQDLQSISDLIHIGRSQEMLQNMGSGQAAFNFDPWRIINLNLFIKQQAKGESFK